MTYREEQPVPNPCDTPPKPAPERPDKDDMRRNIEQAEKDMNMRSNLVDVDVKLIHETDDAYLVCYDEDKPNVWVPKSQSEYEDGVLTVSQWLAEEKGMV